MRTAPLPSAIARLDLTDLSMDGIECKELRPQVENMDAHGRKCLADVYREWARQLDRNAAIIEGNRLQVN